MWSAKFQVYAHVLILIEIFLSEPVSVPLVLAAYQYRDSHYWWQRPFNQKSLHLSRQRDSSLQGVHSIVFPNSCNISLTHF